VSDEVDGTKTGDENMWAIYTVVAARRLQWDNLVWQVPALSLTAQAFLMTITLSADYDVWPRRAAALLSCVICLLSLNLLARQRLSELTDAHFLGSFEAKNATWLDGMVVDGEAEPVGPIHGPRFKERREALRIENKDGRIMSFAARWTSSRVWFVGLALFGLVSLVVFVGSFVGWEWIFPLESLHSHR